MTEQDLEQPQASIDSSATTGARLRCARERLGLSRADIAARTKIAERHLAAIEEERFADLASSTYAVGFARAYARVVGLDEREIAQKVRDELDLIDEGPVRPAPTFEPGDPARVPSSRTAWLAGIAAVAVVVLLLVFWGSYYFPAMPLPDLVSNAPPRPAAHKPLSARSLAGPAPASPQGQVVVTAKEAGVWVKVSDAGGKQLFQKQMALGESYAIPLDAAAPQLRTARPDALAITVGGRPLPPLSDKPRVLTVPISAAALLARAVPATAPERQQQVAPVAASAPVPSPRPAAATPTAKPSAAVLPPAAPAPKPESPSLTGGAGGGGDDAGDGQPGGGQF